MNSRIRVVPQHSTAFSALDRTSSFEDPECYENGIPDERELWSTCLTDEEHFDYGPHRANPEAEQLAMNLSGQLRAPDDLYDRILRDLQLARAAYQEVADVIDRPDYARDNLLVRLIPDVPRTGFDTLNEYYQVREERVISPSLNTRLITFCDNLNTPVLAPEYGALPELQYAEPNWAIGDGDEVTVTPLGTTYRYIFRDGYGDCPSGCICNLYWDIDVHQDGAVDLVDRRGTCTGACWMPDLECCTITSFTACAAHGGDFTPLGFCSLASGLGFQAPCEPVPAVSQWGLILLVILVLTAGTIVLRRRGRKLAEA